MTAIFYFLWFGALLRICVTPGLRILFRGVFVLCVLAGVWVIIGAFAYQAKYSTYLTSVHEFEARKARYFAIERQLQSIAQEHPTSRDVLLQLAGISYQVGNHEKLLEYVQALRRVDPNNASVKSFLKSIQ